MIKTAIMNITGRCNQHCIFCLEGEGGAERASDPTLRQVTGQLKSLRKQGARHITFMGSETLFRKDLPEILARARRLGFTRLGLATNGTALARRGYIGELANCGLEMIEFSLHGHTPELVNKIAGTAFTYGRQARALAELDRNGRVLTIFNVVVCGENREHLKDIVDYVKGNYPNIPARFKFKFVSLQGRELSRVQAGVGLFTYSRVDAAELGRYLTRCRIPFWFHNFPLCLLGRYAAHSEELQNISTDEQYFDLSKEEGHYIYAGRMLGGKIWPVESCGKCSLRPLCPGVEAAYLSLGKGSSELTRSRKDPAPLLCAASKDAGLTVSGAAVRRLLNKLRKEVRLSGLAQPSELFPAVLSFAHCEEMRSFDLRILFRQKAENTKKGARGGGRYDVLSGAADGVPDSPRVASLKKAARKAVKTISERRFTPELAREELLAAVGAAGWHPREEVSGMLVFLNPASPRSLDVQVAVSRGAGGKSAGWTRRYVPEFRNKSFLCDNPQMAEFLSVGTRALDKASVNGLDLEGACRMLTEAAGAVGWRIMR